MSAAGQGGLAAIDLTGKLIAIQPDGSGGYVQNILLDPEVDAAPALNRLPAAFCWPVWMPDGDAILVSTIEHRQPSEPPALLLRRSTDSGALEVLYRNPPGSSLMGDGLPHYVNPSPNGQHALLLTQSTASGLGLVFLDSRGRGPAQPIARGSPLFSAWSPASNAVLLHTGGELSLMELATAPTTDIIATNHVGYRVPAWSPDGKGFVVTAQQERQHSLLFHDQLGKAVSSLAPSWGSAVFAWSPDGALIAQAQSRRSRPQRYTDLQLINVGKTGVRQLRVAECLAFIWSPTGDHLAVLVPEGSEARAGWLILDRDGAQVRRFPSFQPSSEFAIYTAFFDQYALSHRLWSADGSSILGFGRMSYDGPPPELLPSCIYLHELGDGRARTVAPGSVAFWSQQTG